jgi:hypothetical protein
LAAVAAGWRRAYVLRVQDAVDLRVTLAGPTQTKAIITGGMTHSSLTVARTAIQRKGSRLIVRIYVAPIQGSHAVGSYRVAIDLPQTVDEIWFGDPPGMRTVASLFGAGIRVPVPSDGAKTDGVIWRRIKPPRSK